VDRICHVAAPAHATAERNGSELATSAPDRLRKVGIPDRRNIIRSETYRQPQRTRSASFQRSRNVSHQ
jgi:hypothetical protein